MTIMQDRDDNVRKHAVGRAFAIFLLLVSILRINNPRLMDRQENILQAQEHQHAFGE